MTIHKEIILSAPTDRSAYPLRFIHNNRNECVWKEDFDNTYIAIPLCIKAEGTYDEAVSATWGHKSMLETLYAMKDPIVDKYILEDGMVILHVQQKGELSLDMLITAKHASYDDKDWDKPFYPYWQ